MFDYFGSLCMMWLTIDTGLNLVCCLSQRQSFNVGVCCVGEHRYNYQCEEHKAPTPRAFMY